MVADIQGLAERPRAALPLGRRARVRARQFAAKVRWRTESLPGAAYRRQRCAGSRGRSGSIAARASTPPPTNVGAIMELGNQRASGNVEDRRGMGSRRRVGRRRNRHRPRRLLSRLRPEHRDQRRRAGQHPARYRAKCPRGRPPTRRGSSFPRCSAAPRTCGASSSSSRTASTAPRRSCSTTGRCARPAARGNRRWARSTAPATRSSTSTLSFFRDLQTRFRAPGDFAQAYVIAHEVGHHVQKLTGTLAEVGSARGRGPQAERNQHCRCAWNCRPTATPASGDTTRAR